MPAHVYILRGLATLSVFLFTSTFTLLYSSETQPSLVYGNLPLAFEPNHGQSDPQVKFLSRGRNYGLFLTENEAVLVITRSRGQSGAKSHAKVFTDASAQTVRIAWSTTAPTAVRGERELAGKINYFVGRDPATWRSNIPTFGRVRYRNVYPGVDLV